MWLVEGRVSEVLSLAVSFCGPFQIAVVQVATFGDIPCQEAQAPRNLPGSGEGSPGLQLAKAEWTLTTCLGLGGQVIPALRWARVHQSASFHRNLGTGPFTFPSLQIEEVQNHSQVI